MSARSIALQGIGYGARLTALQGFGDAAVTPPVVFQGGGRGFDRFRAQLEAEDEIIVAVVIAALQTGMLQ